MEKEKEMGKELNCIDRKFRFVAYNPCNGHVYTERNALILCAKDAAVPDALFAYREACVRLGANAEHILSLDLLVERVMEYQRTIETRVPDTIGCEIDRCIRGLEREGGEIEE